MDGEFKKEAPADPGPLSCAVLFGKEWTYRVKQNVSYDFLYGNRIGIYPPGRIGQGLNPRIYFLKPLNGGGVSKVVKVR
ncbi:hypothetical protein DRP53_08925 [candidate division WOR-3 bacterium]|uniref:Uncharacterized protein n=1 Tax=candidate division WOR-3 bacterium TaxID=2052148 RepID=A0A660SEH8_UNCW3|nr:MAG: hypothetical protein DRP53_08925 [candidate division WOR-3 bacterium]